MPRRSSSTTCGPRWARTTSTAARGPTTRNSRAPSSTPNATSGNPAIRRSWETGRAGSPGPCGSPCSASISSRRMTKYWWIRSPRSIGLDAPPMRSTRGMRVASEANAPSVACGITGSRRSTGGSGGGRVPSTRGSSIPTVARGSPRDGTVLSSITTTQHSAHQPHPRAKPPMTSEYQWTPRSTLDHATTIAIVTAPTAIPRRTDGDRSRANTIASRGVRRRCGGRVSAGERTPDGRDDLRERRSRTVHQALHGVVQHDLAGDGDQQRSAIGHGVRRRTEHEQPDSDPEHRHRRLAPSCVRKRKTATRSLPRPAAQVAIGRSNPDGAVPRHGDPQDDHRRTHAAVRHQDGLRHRHTRDHRRGLPLAEKEKPPCHANGRYGTSRSANASMAIIRRRWQRGSPLTGALLLDADRGRHRAFPHRTGSERAVRPLGRACQRLVLGPSHVQASIRGPISASRSR